MNGADLPQHPPARAVRPENDVLIVVSDVLGAGVGRAVGEVRVVDLQELGRHGSGSSHDDVNVAKPEVHEGAVGSGQARYGMVGHRAQVREVSDYGPGFRTGRQTVGVVVSVSVPEEAKN